MKKWPPDHPLRQKARMFKEVGEGQVLAAPCRRVGGEEREKGKARINP